MYRTYKDGVTTIEPTRSIMETIGRYELRHHSRESLDSLVELMVRINAVINTPEASAGSDIITNIPDEVRRRARHFSWAAQEKMMLSTWIDCYDDQDFSMLVEKFYETTPYGSNDDVWRASGHDWSVVFIATRQGFGGTQHHRMLRLPFEHLRGDSEWGLAKYSRYIETATMFAITGDLTSFHNDAMQWKLSR